MELSLRGIGRHRDGAGGPLTVIRCDYEPSLVAVLVPTRRSYAVYLARHVQAADVAMVLRHLDTVHARPLGESVCYAPVCAMASALPSQALDVDLRPAIASSA